MTRVLVTGATGFIGRQTLPVLLAQGDEVHAVTSGEPPADCQGLIWHRANLLDAREREQVIRATAATHLLHLAWFVEPGAFWTSPQNVAWAAASIEVARVFAAAGGRRILMAGTCAEYAWGQGDLSERETPLAPTTLYGVSKDAVRRVASRFADEVGLEFAWARLFFLYGPHELPGRLVPAVVNALLRDEPARCGSGRPLRDYLHVADAGAAFAAILHSRVTGAVNVGSGEAVPIRQIVECLGDACGRRHHLAFGSLPDRPDDLFRICADTRRLRDEVGWAPTIPLRDGLHATVEWWRRGILAAASLPGAPLLEP